MAFQYRGVGTAANGNNSAGPLSPTLPSGVVEGDLLVVQFQCFGGTNSRVPSIASPWTSYVWSNGTANHLIAWKIAGASENNPSITLTGSGVANDTQVSRCFAFYSDDATKAVQFDSAGTDSTNASADNIGPITGVTVPTGGGLVLISAGKTNDFNGQGSLTSWTQAALTESTTGSDAGMSLLYRLATPAGATGDLTVTDSGATASDGLGFGKMLVFVEATAPQTATGSTATATATANDAAAEIAALPIVARGPVKPVRTVKTALRRTVRALVLAAALTGGEPQTVTAATATATATAGDATGTGTALTYGARGVVKPVRVATAPAARPGRKPQVLRLEASAPTQTAEGATATATASGQSPVVVGAATADVASATATATANAPTLAATFTQTAASATASATGNDATALAAGTVQADTATATATANDATASIAETGLVARGVIKPVRVRKPGPGQQRIGAPLILLADQLVIAQTADAASATATATGQTPALTTAQTVTGSTATAIASGVDPTLVVVQPLTSATATATGTTPTIGAIQPTTTATATATANAPTLAATLTREAGAATATAMGAAPTVALGEVVATGGTATGTATGMTPVRSGRYTLPLSSPATATATANTPDTVNVVWIAASAVAIAYGVQPTTTAPPVTTSANPVERMRWVPAATMDDANKRLRRTVEVLDASARVQIIPVAASGLVSLTYPQTLFEVDTSFGAVVLTLPTPFTVPGFRVDVVKVTGANTLTANGVTVTTYAGFVSTGAAWRQVA